MPSISVPEIIQYMFSEVHVFVRFIETGGKGGGKGGNIIDMLSIPGTEIIGKKMNLLKERCETGENKCYTHIRMSSFTTCAHSQTHVHTHAHMCHYMCILTYIHTCTHMYIHINMLAHITFRHDLPNSLRELTEVHPAGCVNSGIKTRL